MSALFETLKIKFGEAAAKKLLGIDKQQGNPKYAISFGNMKIDPMRMIANQGIKSLIGGGKMGGMMGPGLLMGGALGLGYMTNPLREGSYNYNPELQGQIDYASGRSFIDRNNSMNALRYNKNSILSGQNVVSGFGTNDYGKQLQKYRKKYGDTMPKERLEQLDREIQDQITDDFDKVDAFMETRDEGGGGTGSAGRGGASPGSAGPGGSDAMGSFRRGGIASL